MAETGVLDQKMDGSVSFNQLAILVLDGSSSMTALIDGRISRAGAVNMAVREMLTRLVASKHKKNFSVAVITFSNTARLRTPITRICDDDGNKVINDNDDYDPLHTDEGGTNLAAGLERARSIAKEFLASATPGGPILSVVIIVMSDGLCSRNSITVAESIKKIPSTVICSTLFQETSPSTEEKNQERESAKSILAAIASDIGRHYKTTYDADTLRNFLIASATAGQDTDIR